MEAKVVIQYRVPFSFDKDDNDEDIIFRQELLGVFHDPKITYDDQKIVTLLVTPEQALVIKLRYHSARILNMSDYE